MVNGSIGVKQKSFTLLRYGAIPLVPFRALWYYNGMANKRETATIDRDEFVEIDTRSVDERNRLTLGGALQGVKRVRVLRSKRGEILLQPLTEVPASEAWLWQNEQALEDVIEGFKDAQAGRTSKLDLDEL